MTKNKGLRPLSQTGLYRIPRNAKQRVAGEGGAKRVRTSLDAFNDMQEERSIHATKGWRKHSVRRSRAQMLISNIHNGGSADLRYMRRFLQEGY